MVKSLSSYYARLNNARTKSTMAPRRRAEIISMGPRVIVDTPKKMMTQVSSMTKMIPVTKSGKGCCKYLFMRSLFRLVRMMNSFLSPGVL